MQIEFLSVMWKTISLLKSFIVAFLFCFQSFSQTYIRPEFSGLKQKEFSLPKHYTLRFDSFSNSSLTYRRDLAFSVYSNQYYKVQKDSIRPGIGPTYQHLLRNQYSSFWKKAGRGEFLIGGIEVIGMVALMLMPKEVTKWEPGWIKAAEKNIARAFSTPPVWDKDDWALNYIGHPIAGTYYYNAVRSQNATPWQSFLFATVQSCIWEYVIEGVAEQPSIQDLIVTPIFGALLGEPIHLATMGMRKNGFRFFEKVFVLVFNPLFVINNGFGPKHNPPLKKKF